MKKKYAASPSLTACEETIRRLLLTACSPDNLDAFLRRIMTTLCHQHALGPGAGVAVILRPGKHTPPVATTLNLTKDEEKRFLAISLAGSKLLKNFLHTRINEGGTKGSLLARIPQPHYRARAERLLEMTAKIIIGRLAQENREKQLMQERDISDAITHLEEIFLDFPATSIEELSRSVLDEARRLTGSRFGFAGYIDPATGWLQLPTLSVDALKKPGFTQKTVVLKKVTGLCGWVLKHKKSILTNSADTDPRAGGSLIGNIKMHNFAAVPVISGKKIVGILALANPHGNYSPAALDVLQKLARVYSLMLANKLAERRKQADELKHQSILDTSSDLIYNLTPQGKLAYVNRAVESYGYKPEEVIGRHFSAFVHPDDRGRVTKAFMAAVRAGRNLLPVISYRLIKKDGTSVFVEQKTSVLPFRSSSPVITGAVRDVTAARLAAKQLEESERKYKTIFNTANAAIIVADAKTGRILDVNINAEKLTGRARGELIGMNRQKLHPAKAAAFYKKQFREHTRSNLPIFSEAEIVRKDGTIAQTQLSTSKFLLEGREVLQGIFQDISAQRNTEATLHNLVAQSPLSIQILDKAGRTLSSNKAHARIFGSVPPADYSIFSDPQLEKAGFGALLARAKRGETVKLPVIRYSTHASCPNSPNVPVWLGATLFPLKDTAGHTQSFVLLHEDVTERRQTEISLRESEKKYRSLIESTDTGYLILDSTGRVLDANKEYLRLTGRRNMKQILGRHVTEWTAPHDQKRNRREIEKCIKTGRARNLRVDYAAPDGTITPIEICATVVKIADSFQIISLCRDIYSRTHTDAQLRESEERYRQLFDNMIDPIFVHDMEGKILGTNKIACRIYGYTATEFLKLTAADIDTPDEAINMERRIKRLLKTGHHRFETRHRLKNGSLLNISVSAQVAVWRGKPAIISVCRDVTAQKLAQTTLQESEEKYRQLVENLGKEYFFYQHDTKGIFTFVSPTATSMLGYTLKQLRTHYATYLTEHQINKKAINHTRLSLRGIQQPPYEVEIYHKDGTTRWLEVKERPLKDPSGKVLGVEGIAHDITALRQTVAQLSASELSYRTLIESSFDLIYTIDRNDIVQYANPAALKHLRKQAAEVIGKPRAAFFPPEVAASQKYALKQVFSGGKPLFREQSLRMSDSIYYQETHLIPIKDAEGQVQSVMGISRDATERKRLENILKESETKYRTLFETSRDALMILEPPNWTFVQANLTTLAMFAANKETDFLKLTPWEISPKKQPDGTNSAKKARRMLAIALKTGSHAFEWEHKRLDGTPLPAEVLLTRVVLDGRQLILASVRDISARKKTEAALLESKNLVESVVENIPLMVFLKEATDLRFVMFNRAGETLLGYDRKMLIGRNDMDLFPPEQSAHFIAKDREVLNNPDVMLDIPEEPVLTAKQGERLLHTRKVCIRGLDGATKYLLGISEDITERKHLEQLLIESEQTLRLIFETASDAIFLKGMDGKYIKTNKACSDYLLVDFKKMIGKTAAEIFPPDIAAETDRDDAEVVKQGKTLFFSKERTLPSGKLYLNYAKTPIFGPDGKVTAVLGVIRDVTALKKMETEIATAKANAALSKVARPIAHDFNNALAAISGYATMIDDDITEETPLKAEIAQILKAVTRAAELSSKLQDFARNPKLEDNKD